MIATLKIWFQTKLHVWLQILIWFQLKNSIATSNLTATYKFGCEVNFDSVLASNSVVGCNTKIRAYNFCSKLNYMFGCRLLFGFSSLIRLGPQIPPEIIIWLQFRTHKFGRTLKIRSFIMRNAKRMCIGCGLRWYRKLTFSA